MPTPALLHSTCTAPKASIVAAASASTSGSCETSVGTPITSCPSARSAATAASSGSARTSAATTRMPGGGERPDHAQTHAGGGAGHHGHPTFDGLHRSSSLAAVAGPRRAVDKQTLVWRDSAGRRPIRQGAAGRADRGTHMTTTSDGSRPRRRWRPGGDRDGRPGAPAAPRRERPARPDPPLRDRARHPRLGAVAVDLHRRRRHRPQRLPARPAAPTAARSTRSSATRSGCSPGSTPPSTSSARTASPSTATGPPSPPTCAPSTG